MAELRKYGVQATFSFPLIDRGQADYEDTPVVHAAGDTEIDQDEAGFGNTTNAFAHRGGGIYSIVLTAAEMQAARIVVKIVDQTAPKAWEDQAVLISTYGHPSAQHAFDLDSPSVSLGGAHFYVSKTGNDANDGLSWPQAKLTISAMVAAASDGDSIHIGPGSYNEAVDASATELNFIGSGPDAIITVNGAQTLQLDKNSSVRRMQIVNARAPCPPNAYAINLAAGSHNVLIEDVVITSVDQGIRANNCNGLHIRRCTFSCPEYSVYTPSASPIGRTIIEDCTCYATGWTNCDAVCFGLSGPTIIRNCVMAVESANANPAYSAIGVALYDASHVLIDNCVMQMNGTVAANAYGVWVNSANAGDIVTILNSTILTTSATGNAYDLYNEDGDGILAVGMTRYDSSKTSGTITIVSPSVSLTAEDTRISIE